MENQNDLFERELLYIETKMWYYHKRYGITDFEAKKIINVVIDSLMNEDSNDTSDYTHKDILLMYYIFENVFLCLERILDSIDFWEK